jgi:hypothetical protein
MKVLIFLFLLAQETQMPLDQYCVNYAPRKSEPKAHECHCSMTCDDNGAMREGTECKYYCHHDNCACHLEDQCPKK